MSGPPPDRSVEVCREFTRQRCVRSDNECRYAHPPPNVEVMNGRVTCCVDAIKGRCQRENCRYFHPPPHIGDQVLRSGPPGRSGGGGGGGGYDSFSRAPRGGRMGEPGMGGPFGGPGGMDRPASRSDGLEVCKEFLRGRCSRKEDECRFAHPPDNLSIASDNTVTACIDFIKGRCQREPCRYFHPPEHLAARIRYGGSGGAPSAGRKRPFNSSSGGGRMDEYASENGGFKRPAYEDGFGN